MKMVMAMITTEKAVDARYIQIGAFRGNETYDKLTNTFLPVISDGIGRSLNQSLVVASFSDSKKFNQGGHKVFPGLNGDVVGLPLFALLFECLQAVFVTG